MEAIRIATAQFEHRSGDKKYNIGQIGRLSAYVWVDRTGMSRKWPGWTSKKIQTKPVELS